MFRDTKKLRKRIFLNLDGTGQAAYSKEGGKVGGKITSVAVSNVARLGRATLLEDVDEGFEQVVYYQSGVAARAELSKFQLLREGGFGIGLISNVREAYGFLCNNYDLDDEIYITGFSRGAFTARSVAGLIGRVGILTKRGLELFYEAFDYYENYKKYEKEDLPCPVSEKAKTTRKFLDNGDEIKITAVGVWDTVGGLSGDYGFHDVSLGKHIENAYHVLSLDERRAYFEPTLWEVPGETPRSSGSFEQCWMPGDHSNIGGSWDDQQLADLSLAWMMSRLEVLGVKFDQAYLYHEFLKFNEYVKDTGPTLRGTGGDDAGPAYPKDTNLNPRQWGEGRSRDIYPSRKWGGKQLRTPMMYCQPKVFPAGYMPWSTEYIAQGTVPLKNTNETFHPSLRYRHFCKNQGKLDAHDQGPYNPESMSAWTWPSAQKDGQIGSTATGSTTYSRTIGQNITEVKESTMGYYEQLLLAIYDQDPTLRKRDGSIWKKVLGGNGPPQEIKAKAAKIVAHPESDHFA